MGRSQESDENTGFYPKRVASREESVDLPEDLKDHSFLKKDWTS